MPRQQADHRLTASVGLLQRLLPSLPGAESRCADPDPLIGSGVGLSNGLRRSSHLSAASQTKLIRNPPDISRATNVAHCPPATRRSCSIMFAAQPDERYPLHHLADTEKRDNSPNTQLPPAWQRRLGRPTARYRLTVARLSKSATPQLNPSQPHVSVCKRNALWASIADTSGEGG